MANRSCFILMPFTKAKDLESKDLTFIYEDIIQRTVKAFQYNGERYFQNVSRYESKVGSIIEGIVNRLNDSELVIADLTGLNPNVMYELGVRHSLRKGTIIITHNINELPSDLRDYSTIEYKYCKDDNIAQANNYKEFETKIHAALIEVIAQTKCDSPVLNYLNQRQRFRNELEIERVKNNFVIIRSMAMYVHDLDDMFSAIKPNFNYEENLQLLELFQIRINALLESLTTLNISYPSIPLFTKIVNAKIFVNNILRLFNKAIEMWTMEVKDQKFSTAPTIHTLATQTFINIFLIETGRLEFIVLKNIFNSDGILEEHLIGPLKISLEQRIDELGIEKGEIISLL